MNNMKTSLVDLARWAREALLLTKLEREESENRLPTKRVDGE